MSVSILQVTHHQLMMIKTKGAHTHHQRALIHQRGRVIRHKDTPNLDILNTQLQLWYV